MAVKIELDAKIVLGWVSEDFNSNLHNTSLIMDCRPSSTKFFKWWWNIAFVKANKCANALIRKGLNSSQDYRLFDGPLMDLCILLFYDNYGLFYERLQPLHSPYSVFTPKKIYIYIYTHFIPLIFNYYPVNLAIYIYIYIWRSCWVVNFEQTLFDK